MRRLALLVSVLALLVAGLTACSSKTDGSAVGGDPNGNPTTTSRTTRPSRPPTTSNTNSGALPSNPCSLLTAQAQAQLGISGGERDDIGSARGCKWRLRGPEETYIFTVDIRDAVGIKDIPSSSNPKPLPDIGGHKAVQLSAVGGAVGSCSIALGVGNSSTVTQSVTAGTNQQKACELALQMARLVEPELP